MEKYTITIGRQFGSGGREIGRQLAEKLGINFFDKQLIVEAEKLSGIRKEMFERSDERPVASLFHALSTSFSFYNSFTPESLYRLQSDAIRTISETTSSVIVGRTADYVLRDMDNCINIFICAPLEVRQRLVSERNGISDSEARKLIDKTDRSRKEYYEFFTDKRWGYSSSYHLTIDSSILGIEQTVPFLLDFIQRSR